MNNNNNITFINNNFNNNRAVDDEVSTRTPIDLPVPIIQNIWRLQLASTRHSSSNNQSITSSNQSMPSDPPPYSPQKKIYKKIFICQRTINKIFKKYCIQMIVLRIYYHLSEVLCNEGEFFTHPNAVWVEYNNVLCVI